MMENNTLNEEVYNDIVCYQEYTKKYKHGLMFRDEAIYNLMDVAGIGLFHNSIVKLKEAHLETQQIGYLKINHINGKSDWDFNDYDGNVDIIIDEISIRFITVRSNGEQYITDHVNLYHIGMITKLEPKI
jgi:hypothetical protein